MGNNTKKTIRNEMKSVLAGLDARWIKGASAELCNNLIRLYSEGIDPKCSNILAWTSFFAGEPDLSGFIASCVDSLNIYLPRILPDGGMDFISIGRDWGTQIEEGVYGIPEPIRDAGNVYSINDSSSTLVLVPGLAFDRYGNRLGRGKGYYDRFLGKSGMKSAIKVGIAWEMQIVDEIVPQAHDIAMDWICHERGFIECVRAY
jgi:5-formyltetrahydrofolate cyclo-ligase